MKMNAALWYGPEDIKIEKIDVPNIGSHEILVKIGSALTCGTDFKLFRHGHPVLVKKIPAPFGHELAGTIVQVGDGVTDFHIGDRVVAANSAPCDDCFYCLEGQWNLCENLEFLNGAYAEYIKIPARIVQKNLYRIPESISFRKAAASEPLACVLHCIDKISPRSGQTICILGTGTCGLLFIQLGKLYGTKIICIGRGEEKLKIAKEMGADYLFSVLEEGVNEKIREVTKNGYGPDIVIDATGQTESWELATGLVRKGGSVWFYGGCAKGTHVSLDTYRLHYDEITCRGVFHHTPRHFAKALNLIASGKVNVDSLITGERKLTELNQVFQKGVSHNPLKFAIIP